MKNFRSFVYACITVLACVAFASCGDDDKNEPGPDFAKELLGTWQCVESDFSPTSNSYEYAIEKGQYIVFFNGNFKSEDNLISGKKCFVLYSHENPSDFTEARWDKEVEWWNGVQDEFGPVYTLDKNTLSIIECDLDRNVGTITINNDVMTFNYKYQNWSYNTGTMTSESKSYTAKFRKI